MVCGPGGDDAPLGRGPARRRLPARADRSRWSGTCAARSATAGTASGAAVRLPRRPGVRRWPEATAGWECDDTMPTRPRSAEAGGLEVHLLRRLPALDPQPRGRAPELPDEVRDLHFLEATGPRSRAPTTSRWSRARSRRRTRSSGSARSRRSSAKLITIGACANAGGIQALRNFADVDEFVDAVYASPEYISTLATSTPISAPRPGRLRAPGLPDRPAPDPGGDHRAAARAAAGIRSRVGLRRVQAARQRLRHGRARHRLPRPGHPRRLRRDLPGLRPRLLRLLRAQGDAEHRAPCAGWRGLGRVSEGCSTASARQRVARRSPPSGAEATRGRSERWLSAPWRRIEVGALAPGRGRGRSARPGEGDRVETSAWRSTSRRASSRPCCATALHRRARHHLADLRDLPDRLPGERDRGDRGRARDRGPGRGPGPAPADLLRGVAGEPRPARVHAPRARLPRLRGSDRDGPPSTPSRSSAGCGSSAAGNEILRVVGGAVHLINLRVGGFYRARVRPSSRRCARSSSAPARTSSRPSAGRALEFPDHGSTARWWRSPTATLPDRAGRLVSSEGLDIGPREFPEHFVEEQIEHSTALHARIRARGNYVVGPLARFGLNHERSADVPRRRRRGRAAARAATRSGSSSSAAWRCSSPPTRRSG